jgi:hypothetical protein
MARHEEFNPFYCLVLLTGVLFVLTALAYVVSMIVSPGAISPVAPGTPAASPLAQWLNQHGGRTLLWEAGALAVAAVLAMGLDRWRSWHASRAKGPPAGRNRL